MRSARRIAKLDARGAIASVSESWHGRGGPTPSGHELTVVGIRVPTLSVPSGPCPRFKMLASLLNAYSHEGLEDAHAGHFLLLVAERVQQRAPSLLNRISNESLVPGCVQQRARSLLIAFSNQGAGS